MEKIYRSNSIDLLRLICMIMIVSLHYFGWGGIRQAENITTFNYFFQTQFQFFADQLLIVFI